MKALLLVCALAVLCTGLAFGLDPHQAAELVESRPPPRPAYIYEDVLSSDGERLASSDEQPTYYKNLRIYEFQAKTIKVDDKLAVDIVHNNRLKRIILSSYPYFRDLFDAYEKNVLNYLRGQSPKPSSLAEAEFKIAARALRLKVQGRFKDFEIYSTEHGSESGGLAFLGSDLKLYLLSDAVVEKSHAQV